MTSCIEQHKVNLASKTAGVERRKGHLGDRLRRGRTVIFTTVAGLGPVLFFSIYLIMPKTRAVKTAWMETIRGLMGSHAVVFVNYRGLSALEIEQLRRSLREQGSRLQVVKNSLLKKIVLEEHIELPAEFLDQPLAAAAHSDEVLLAKIFQVFVKDHPQVQLQGILISATYQGSEVVTRLSSLPTREVLLGKLVGSIAAPMFGLVMVLSGNLRGLVSVLAQYRDSKTA